MRSRLAFSMGSRHLNSGPLASADTYIYMYIPSQIHTYTHNKTHAQRADVGAYTCNPSMKEVETGRWFKVILHHTAV